MWLLWTILIGLVAGWATGHIMKGSGYGTLMDIVIGFVGGVIGGWLLGLLGIYAGGGFIARVLVSILGAVILVVVVRALKRA